MFKEKYKNHHMKMKYDYVKNLAFHLFEYCNFSTIDVGKKIAKL